jgi:hypothetical protein
VENGFVVTGLTGVVGVFIGSSGYRAHTDFRPLRMCVTMAAMACGFAIVQLVHHYLLCTDRRGIAYSWEDIGNC